MCFNKKAGTAALLLFVFAPASSAESRHLYYQDIAYQDTAYQQHGSQKSSYQKRRPQNASPFKKEKASIKITTNVRTRYEYFDSQLGAVQKTDDVIATRISSQLTLQKGPFALDAELVDSRLFRSSEFTPLGTDDINTTEPTQLSISWKSQLNDRDKTAQISELSLKAGRFTMDIGSRRLVARNRFRNTINTFDGLKADYRKESFSTTFFYTFPVSRFPERYTEESASEFELDKSSSNQRFYGFFSDVETDRLNLAFYAFRDRFTSIDKSGQTGPQSNTQRNTFGHLAKVALTNNTTLDYEVAFQRGNRGFQAIRAEFIHTAVTSSLDNVNMQLFFDKATGDDPATDTYEGFSTLFGARRFEFGPTGIFGLFARDNMSSPGISTQVAINEYTELQLKYRYFNIHKSGNSGRLNGIALANHDFLGTLFELRLRLQLNPSIKLEAGFAKSRLNEALLLSQPVNNYGYLQSSYFF
ncbi:alginate export family protein [Alteromonas sp. A081]|uniref:alginate export family protein n=1 Tax=Alteromonas sp. A081 TaxID=3410269 RepID=UPI003B983063